MKEKRIEKEIKKAQKKGIYNPKLKLGIVALILVIGTVIGVSYAYYTGTANNTLTISGTVSKKINITVQSNGHGTVDGLNIATAQTDYGTASTFKVTPESNYEYESTSCKDTTNQDVTNKVSPSYSNNTLTITPRTINDITCTVEYERVRTLGEIKEEIIKTAKDTSPNFNTGCPLSDDDKCSGVYKMDDYSNSTSLNYNNPGGTSYYFRGAVENNYVQFGKDSSGKELTWRIVRINGDGSIRLLLDSDIGKSKFNSTINAKKYAGYTYDNETPCTNANPCISDFNNGQYSSNNTGTSSTIKSKLETWYQQNLADYNDKIELGTYCNDTSYGSETEELYYEELYYNYSAYERLYNSNPSPQLTCSDPKAGEDESLSDDTYNGYHTYGGVYKLKIGLLSADEMIYAGLSYTNNEFSASNNNYLYKYYDWWSLSPSEFGYNNAIVFRGSFGNVSNIDDPRDPYTVCPVINLKTEGLTATGEGTKEKPFVIK